MISNNNKKPHVAIEYMLFPTAKRLTFDIIEQTPLWKRNFGDEPLCYDSSFDISIRSSVFGTVFVGDQGGRLYLLGSADSDNQSSASITFPNNSERDKYQERLKSALLEWAEHVFGNAWCVPDSNQYNWTILVLN